MSAVIVLALSQVFAIIGDLAGQRCVRVTYGQNATHMLIGTSIVGLFIFPLLSGILAMLPETIVPASEVEKWPSTSHIFEMLVNVPLMAQMASLAVAFQFSEAGIYKSSWGAVLKNAVSMLSPLLVFPLSLLSLDVGGTTYRCEGVVVAIVMGTCCAIAASCVRLSQFPKVTSFLDRCRLESDFFNSSTLASAFMMCMCYSTWSVAIRNSHVGHGVNAYDWIFLEKVVGSFCTVVCVAVTSRFSSSSESPSFGTMFFESLKETAVGLLSVLLFILPLYARIGLQFFWLARKDTGIAIAAFWLNGSRLLSTFGFSWVLRCVAPSVLGLSSESNTIFHCSMGHGSLRSTKLGILATMLGTPLFVFHEILRDGSSETFLSGLPSLRQQHLIQRFPSRIHFFGLGDWGCSTLSPDSCRSVDDLKGVVNLMSAFAKQLQEQAIPLSFVLNLGDAFYDNGVHSLEELAALMDEWQYIWQLQGLANVKWHGVLGNHDFRGNVSLVVPRTHGPLHYPSKWYDWYEGDGMVHIIAVDTNWVQSKSICSKRDKGRRNRKYYNRCIARFIEERDKQVTWLRTVLKDDSSRWRIVFGHHPVYSAGRWAFHDVDNSNDTLASLLVPIFEQFHVHAYVCGHEHSMQYLRRNEVGYFVFGSGGSNLEDEPQNTEYMDSHNSSARLVRSIPKHGFGHFLATPERICVASAAVKLDSANDDNNCFMACTRGNDAGWKLQPKELVTCNSINFPD